MAKVHVTAKRDFLESITTARPLAALAELVWNGFDSGTDSVQVFLELNDLNGIQAIRIRDHGDGINYLKVEELFGSLGESWKKIEAVKTDVLSMVRMVRVGLKHLHLANAWNGTQFTKRMINSFHTA